MVLVMVVWQNRVNKTESFITNNKSTRYIKISHTIRKILITGTNNVIKLVRFVNFSLYRFSVRVDRRYFAYHCQSFHFVIFKRLVDLITPLILIITRTSPQHNIIFDTVSSRLQQPLKSQFNRAYVKGPILHHFQFVHSYII